MIKINFILGFIFVASIKCICFAENQATCKERQLSISDYDNKVEAVLDGEPEHLMIILDKIIKANLGGDKETVQILSEIVKSKAPALLKIPPPKELGEFHRKLINYHETVEKAVEAAIRENIDFESIYTRKCYEALLDYFQELKTILIEKECSEGDIEALENTIIPGIINILNTKLSEESLQKKERLKSEIQAAWDNLLQFMKSGNVEKVKSISTKEGYDSLLNLKHSSEGENEMLERLGQFWSRDKIRWVNISENKLVGAIGPLMKSAGMSFIKDGKVWKFNQIYPGM